MQSKKHSAAEVLTGTIIGYFIALIAQVMIFPVYGLPVRVFENMQIAGIFTVISLVRGYVFRRIWNRIEQRR